MPPNPVATGAENDGGAGGAENDGAIGAGAGIIGADGKLGVDILFAEPAIFSCVLPNAAIPKTAPIAK